jgi:hypothetical protein
VQTAQGLAIIHAARGLARFHGRKLMGLRHCDCHLKGRRRRITSIHVHDQNNTLENVMSVGEMEGEWYQVRQ